MTELQNDRQDKNNMPPDLRSRGHKNYYMYVLIIRSSLKSLSMNLRTQTKYFMRYNIFHKF